MPRPTKKKRLDDHQSAAAADGDLFASCFDDLSIDELANIFGFLPVEDIMRLRRINKKSVDAARITHAPIVDIDYERFFWFHDQTPEYFRLHSVENYIAMRNMSTALPNLQQLGITSLGERHKYSDGEDPDEGKVSETAEWTTSDIAIITNFGQLRELAIIESSKGPSLNGRYPFLFNSFPLLQKLCIQMCRFLKWDLDMLAGLPVLKELICVYNFGGLSGNINSLKVLKDTLEKLVIQGSEGVEGNLMDLADFPCIKVLNLHGTVVTGDIRDISNNDFPALEKLNLPKSVYGGSGHEIERISDAPDLVRAVHRLKRQRPTLSMLKNWQGMLSDDSPDQYWYEGEIGEEVEVFPPFYIRFVEAGSRIGYRWVTMERGFWIDDDEEGDGDDEDDNPCEVNWLDAKPDRKSPDYTKYIHDLARINLRVKLYKGFHEPPTEAEYNRLIEEHIGVR